MEPMLPEENRVLTDLACELIEYTAQLKGSIQHDLLLHSLGDLVREMNCYYSNLIEDHHTHPIDIKKALNKQFDKPADHEKRNLQLEAVAHITVQRTIDRVRLPDDLLSQRYIRWVHKLFYGRLPEELCWVTNPDTGARIRVIPGEFRDGEVLVGRHRPPPSSEIVDCIHRLEQAYTARYLSRPQQVIATACLHHRFLWIHPFYDGNGRVARLLTHAYMRHIGVGNPLWSVARGLARQKDEYKKQLQQADNLRDGDLDGRGVLSQRALIAFCEFFLRTCIDQVQFMSQLLEPKTLIARIQSYTRTQVAMGNLLPQSDRLLERAVMEGSFNRGRATEITSYKEAQASKVLNQLVRQGLLISDTVKGPVRLGIPVEVMEDWFPQLYPSHMKKTGIQKTH